MSIQAADLASLVTTRSIYTSERSNCKTLLVLLSRELMTHADAVGEMTVAVANDIRGVVLQCGNYCRLQDIRLDKLGHLLGSQSRDLTQQHTTLFEATIALSVHGLLVG